MKQLSLFLVLVFSGCGGGFQQIDHRVESLMQETSGSIQANSPTSPVSGDPFDPMNVTSETPYTVNPRADELAFLPAGKLDMNLVAQSLDSAAETLESSGKLLSLEESLAWANTNAKEMLFAKYDYVYTTLSLLGELHLWGPRFSNSVNADVAATSSDGLYDTSLTVLNDFGVSRKLPEGGSVTASALTEVVRSLHTTATSEDDSSTTLGLTVKIPLLKDSGAVAREFLIQARRNMVYAARSYERFRRSFFREVVGDYLALVVQKQSLENAQRGVDSLRQLAQRQAALYDAGRARFYDSADAENQALASVARLSRSWEQYRLALDRFKIKIGWPVQDQVQVEQASIGVVPPLVDPNESVVLALTYRLDLQNEYDRLVDTKRAVENSINALLPDIEFRAGTTLESDSHKPIKFDARDFDFTAGLSVNFPLDKELERVAVRQSQITLEKAVRSFRQSRDNVAIGVRSALRNIEVFQFTHDLQLRNVEIAQLGLDSIYADPDRVSVLDQTRAISDLQGAQDARDSARRDLELSILDYLLQAGQLRVGDRGELELPVDNPNRAISLQ